MEPAVIGSDGLPPAMTSSGRWTWLGNNHGDVPMRMQAGGVLHYLTDGSDERRRRVWSPLGAEKEAWRCCTSWRRHGAVAVTACQVKFAAAGDNAAPRSASSAACWIADGMVDTMTNLVCGRCWITPSLFFP